MRFAKWVFTASAIYGLLVSLPMLFLEERMGRENPPAITHPEFFYGFAGVVIAWQIMFWLVGRDPIRYRPVMLVGVIEKLSFVIGVPILYAQHRVAGEMIFFAGMDALMMVLFIVAYFKTASPSA